MIIKREILEEAASAGMLKYGQIDNLLVFLVQQELRRSREPGSGRFSAALLYLGGMLALGAALLFAVMTVNTQGVSALLWISVLYGICAIGLAHWCAQRGMGFSAAFFSVMAIGLACSAMYAAQTLPDTWAGSLNALVARLTGL